MRVLHLVRALRVGGLEQVVVNLLEGLARRGVACHLGCLVERGVWAERARTAGVWVGGLGARGRWRVLADLRRYLRREGIALIHSHNSQAHVFGVLASLATGIPLVHTKHGQNWPDDPRWVWKSRQLSRFSRAVVAVSEDIRRIVTQIEKVPARKVLTIVNGVDTEAFRPRPEERAGLRARLGLPAEGFIVGSIGRLAWEKNYELLVRAFARLAAQVPAAHLALVGDGPYRERLAAAAQGLGLGERCRLVGPRENVAEWLNALDVFCLPSLTEGTSITLLEAGACGRPAVVTRVGGNAEIVEDGVTGLVVPAGEERALSAALLALAGDGERRRALGAAARARIVERYGAAAMVAAYANLYEAVLGGRTRRPAGAERRG